MPNSPPFVDNFRKELDCAAILPVLISMYMGVCVCARADLSACAGWRFDGWLQVFAKLSAFATAGSLTMAPSVTPDTSRSTNKAISEIHGKSLGSHDKSAHHASVSSQFGKWRTLANATQQTHLTQLAETTLSMFDYA